ncbi:J domain-containing protein [Streptomyces sp. ACA25]|nr:J domain-containing protein [Streptomyces sp. ACA25]MDB1086308.1 J domain-containing protein [Streptomyces sp. ACA25]
MTNPEDPQPEDAATQRLDRAVRAAETALIEFEIAVETFRIEVENFSRLHEERLGPLHTRLEELEAELAEAVAARTGDPADQRRAREARSLVLPMPQVSELFNGWLEADGFQADAAAMLTERPVQPPPRVRPGEEARKLFRELIRKVHPDLASDEAERTRRGAFVARVNQAYALGDAAALRKLAEEWGAGPVAERPAYTRAEELYARLEWLARRKELLSRAAAALEESAIGSMLKMAPDDPDALLAEIAEDLRQKVAARERELAQERGTHSGP